MTNTRRFGLFATGFALIVLTTLSLGPTEALARAGGGGGGGGGGGIVGIILMPFIIIYSIILTWLVARKNRQSKKLLRELARHDQSWDMNRIKQRIETIYFKVQEAWMERDQDLAKEFMSERLYRKHKMQTDLMIKQGEQNVLERINLKKVTIVEVADFKDDSNDRIWVQIEGSMIDYVIDDKTRKLISGDRGKIEEFEELWKFTKDANNEWVLDEIDQKVEISDLMGFKSSSEALGEGAS